ncbi:MAG TPA: recombinase family protein [Thermoleophilia bacterium]|nr:recombinase family protein [Thermoleophilia bacterium]
MKVVGYVRVSTEDQAKHGFSLEAQTEKIQSYASLYDLDLVGIEVDAGLSAKDLDRPGVQRALGLLESGEAEGLLIVKLDRLTRSVTDMGNLVNRYFKEGGYVLMSVAENLDARSAAGRLMINLIGSISQWERETTGERTRDVLAHKKSQQENYCRPPFGFQWACGHESHGPKVKRREACGKLVKDPDQEEALFLAQAMRAEGMGYTRIANFLNEVQAKTPRGGDWFATSVSRMLKGATA